MLKSINIQSATDALPAVEDTFESINTPPNIKGEQEDNVLPQFTCLTQEHLTDSTCETLTHSLTTVQLSRGMLQLYAPPLNTAKRQLKELIGKQNKIYLDLSAEKFRLDNDEMDKLQDIMNSVKMYREKLLKIKKQMQNIYQRTKALKKRAINIQTHTQKQSQRKIQKQQQEESLIAKQCP